MTLFIRTLSTCVSYSINYATDFKSDSCQPLWVFAEDSGRGKTNKFFFSSVPFSHLFCSCHAGTIWVIFILLRVCSSNLTSSERYDMMFRLGMLCLVYKVCFCDIQQMFTPTFSLKPFNILKTPLTWPTWWSNDFFHIVEGMLYTNGWMNQHASIHIDV